MNDSELEESLRALRPVAPPPALEQRVAQDLATAAPHLNGAPVPAPSAGVLRRGTRGPFAGRWRDLGWAVAGAAVAFAALAWFSPSSSTLTTAPVVSHITPAATSPAAENTFEHASATEELLSAEDAEIVETEAGLVRPVRYSYRERHAWANPRTGAQVVLEVPRQEIYLLPVSLQ